VVVGAVVIVGALAAVATSASADPVVMAAGDIACSAPGTLTPGDCSQAYTANLMVAQQSSSEGLAAALALGDLQYDSGGLGDFRAYFDPTWGRLRGILHPALGNHEYATSGASGYFDYFAGIGVGTGARGEGWYSFDVGAWHLIALNSSDGCKPVSCAAGSAQETWLRNDLAATTKPCVLAYWHHPLSTAAAEGAMWQDLYAAGADLVLAGHVHTYRRPSAHDASGASDPNGPREAIVGTGGKSGGIYGVLKLTLHDGSYDWQFVGSGTSDSGSASCHGSPPAPPPVAKPTASFAATTAGLTATFADTSTGAPTGWTWDFGDGGSSTAQSPSHSYARGGTYAVKLTAANAGGSTTATRQVTVSAGATPGPGPGSGGTPPFASPAGTGGASATALQQAIALSAVPTLALPAPTGGLPVGVRSTFVTDRTRIDSATHKPRALPIRVWYPAAPGATGPRAPYLPAAIQQVAEQALGLPAGSLGVDTHAIEGAPARSRIRGVVLVSPGLGTLAALQTALMVDLASRGYAVVAIDHPHDSAAVLQPGGVVITGDPSIDRHVDRAFRDRLRDVNAVLGQLSRLVPQRRASTRLAMIGHSIGGAVAAQAMLAHPSLRAGVDLDGSPRGRVVTKGLARPFGLLLEPGVRVLTGFGPFIAHLRGPHPILTLPVKHYGFTDFAVFNPQARLTDAALGQALEQRLETGTLADLEAGQRAVDRQRRFLADFLRRYVAG
jgi:PKD domain-containing protein/serine aminopeptidase S33 family/calcineurin-like phosphoesterase family protein